MTPSGLFSTIAATAMDLSVPRLSPIGLYLEHWSGNMTKDRPKKVIVGSFTYCVRAMRPWYAMGYRIVKSKRWGDGKYSYVLEKCIND